MYVTTFCMLSGRTVKPHSSSTSSAAISGKILSLSMRPAEDRHT